jgi:two-component sensor histidine kinase
MGITNFEEFAAGERQDISSKEHGAARELFEDCVTEAVGNHIRQTILEESSEERGMRSDQILLKRFMPNLSYVAITVGKYADTEGIYGTVGIRWLTGRRVGENTLYGPDPETAGVLRRDISVEAQSVIRENLLKSIRRHIQGTAQSAESLLEIAAEATSTEEARRALERGERTRQVGLEEVQWLGQIITGATLHGRFPRKL